MYLVTMIPLVYLFLANIVALLSQNYSVTPRYPTFNLTHTISYGSYGTHVVIYILVFTH